MVVTATPNISANFFSSVKHRRQQFFKLSNSGMVISILMPGPREVRVGAYSKRAKVLNHLTCG